MSSAFSAFQRELSSGPFGVDIPRQQPEDDRDDGDGDAAALRAAQDDSDSDQDSDEKKACEYNRNNTKSTLADLFARSRGSAVVDDIGDLHASHDTKDDNDDKDEYPEETEDVERCLRTLSESETEAQRAHAAVDAKFVRELIADDASIDVDRMIATLSEISTDQAKVSKSGLAKRCIEICIAVSACLQRGLLEDDAPERLLPSFRCAWLRARSGFAQYIAHQATTMDASLDLFECLWLTRAQLYSAANPAGVKTARGRKFLAGELLRLAMDERVFGAVFRTHLKRPAAAAVLAQCKLAAAGDINPEHDRTDFQYEEAKQMTDGVMKLCASFQHLNEITLADFCRIAARVDLAYVRAATYVQSRLAYRTTLRKTSELVVNLCDEFHSPRAQMSYEGCAARAIELGTTFMLPVVSHEDAVTRTQGGKFTSASVLPQAVGVGPTNKLRKLASTTANEVLRTPTHPYFDAWMLVMFDNLVAATSGTSVIETCSLFEHDWHKHYARLQDFGSKIAPRLPYIVRILHTWYVQVTTGQEYLAQLPFLERTEMHAVIAARADKTGVLIHCGDIHCCLQVWYLVIARIFGGKTAPGQFVPVYARSASGNGTASA